MSERDNSIYDDAAEYLAERDAMRAVIVAAQALVDETNARYPNRDEWPRQYLDLRAALLRLLPQSPTPAAGKE